jgi:hypothetical protein
MVAGAKQKRLRWRIDAIETILVLSQLVQMLQKSQRQRTERRRRFSCKAERVQGCRNTEYSVDLGINVAVGKPPLLSGIPRR